MCSYLFILFTCRVGRERVVCFFSSCLFIVCFSSPCSFTLGKITSRGTSLAHNYHSKGRSVCTGILVLFTRNSGARRLPGTNHQEKDSLVSSILIIRSTSTQWHLPEVHHPTCLHCESLASPPPSPSPHFYLCAALLQRNS
jgi:hypothetical protein